LLYFISASKLECVVIKDILLLNGLLPLYDKGIKKRVIYFDCDYLTEVFTLCDVKCFSKQEKFQISFKVRVLY